MTSKNNYQRGDIVLLPFPFSDLSSQKKRPVLVLTDMDQHGDFLVAPVTSQPGHLHTVSLSNQDMAAGQLPKTSWVKADKLFTLNRSVIIKHYGSVKPALVASVLQVLCPKLDCCR